MQSFIKLTITTFKLFMREPVALFFTLVFPLGLLALFGAIFGNEPSSQFGGEFGYIDGQVPALAAIVIGTVALQSIPIATATAREQKVLRRFKATPMKPIVYIAADVVVNLFTGLIGMILLAIVAKIVFGLRFGGSWLMVLLAFLFSSLAFIAFGYIIASVAPTSRVAQALGSILYFPMMFLSGAAFPLAIMPEGLQNAAQFLPMTHMVKLLQDLWFGLGWNTTSVLVLGVMLVIGTIVSVFVFRWE